MRTLAAALEWREVSLELGSFSVREASLRVEESGWVAVVGPTGAGKTLLLEVAAGFCPPSSGKVLRRGIDVTQSPPERRGIAYVPQDDLLFPHLDVRGNVTFAMSGAAGRPEELSRVASALGIAHLLDRPVRTLSGGEAQRTAVARALLAGGSVLLLDEATSALDEATRRTVGRFLEAERARHGLAIVQVTHDLHEAHGFSDQVITIEAGRLRTDSAARAPRLRTGGVA